MALGQLVEAHRLVTIVGPGGAGKTRLAQELARGQLEHDAFLVELAPVGDPAAVPDAVAVGIGLREAGPLQGDASAGLDRLVEHLADRPTIVVMDNCEHVIGESARVVEQLLVHCPLLRVLATSREALGLGGETIWPVPPLAIEDAVDLFTDRAGAAGGADGLARRHRRRRRRLHAPRRPPAGDRAGGGPGARDPRAAARGPAGRSVPAPDRRGSYGVAAATDAPGRRGVELRPAVRRRAARVRAALRLRGGLFAGGGRGRVRRGPDRDRGGRGPAGPPRRQVPGGRRPRRRRGPVPPPPDARAVRAGAPGRVEGGQRRPRPSCRSLPRPRRARPRSVPGRRPGRLAGRDRTRERQPPRRARRGSSTSRTRRPRNASSEGWAGCGGWAGTGRRGCAGSTLPWPARGRWIPGPGPTCSPGRVGSAPTPAKGWTSRSAGARRRSPCCGTSSRTTECRWPTRASSSPSPTCDQPRTSAPWSSSTRRSPCTRGTTTGGAERWRPLRQGWRPTSGATCKRPSSTTWRRWSTSRRSAPSGPWPTWAPTSRGWSRRVGTWTRRWPSPSGPCCPPAVSTCSWRRSSSARAWGTCCCARATSRARMPSTRRRWPSPSRWARGSATA